MRDVMQRHPFEIVAWVVLPDHMHAIWTLPDGDADFSGRWGLIKAGFSRSIAATEDASPSRHAKRERGIWQRRFWEHLVRDELDLHRHVDYVHVNPVKHGYAARASDWPHSSIHRYIERGWLNDDWACDPEALRLNGERA
ncbi:MAG TPA: transposase [Rhodanobacteraceae bacterium]|nr:transposase [Rhodanobacteraceae bacterium]